MAENNEQVLGIFTQYIKDLSFENVHPVSRLETNAEQQPKIDVNIEVKTSKIEGRDNLYSVELITKIQAKLDKPLFILDLNYTGEFVIEGFPDHMLNPLLNIECPRLLFPFARSIIANAIGEGGFPPLYLSPVNFMELYEKNYGPLSSDTLQ